MFKPTKESISTKELDMEDENEELGTDSILQNIAEGNSLKALSPSKDMQCSQKDHETITKWIKKTKPYRMTQYAKELFPNNYYQRMMFYCWLRTTFNYGVREFNPQYINMNFVGPAGAGKSGTAYEFGFIMSDFLSNIPGVEGHIPFSIYTTTLQGINDFAEIIGIVHLDNQTEQTKLYPNSALPGKGTHSFGCIFLDDFNRGHAHIISAAMEYVNRGRYNNFSLPAGWFFVACTNPQGKNYRTNTLDQAQMTRFLTVEFNPTHDMFMTQLAVQDTASKMIGLFSKYGKELLPDLGKVSKSVVEINNNQRSAMMFAHLFPYIEDDNVVLELIGRSMFGTNFMTNLKSLLANEMPMDPDEMLGDSEDPEVVKKNIAIAMKKPSVTDLEAGQYLAANVKEKVSKFINEGKRDLLFTTMKRLESYVKRNYETAEFAPHSVLPLIEFIKIAPSESRYRLLNSILNNKNLTINKLMTSDKEFGVIDGKKRTYSKMLEEATIDIVSTAIKPKKAVR